MTLTGVALHVEIAFADAPFATSPTWTDITGYVKHIAAKRGRDNELGQIQAGTATLLLDNADGRFTPGRATSPSPYLNNILPRRQVRVRAVKSGVSHPIWAGYTERWNLTHPGGGDYSEAELECVDGLKLLGDTKLLDFWGEYVKSLGATAYYPLTEPKGSILFADKSARRNPPGVFYRRSTTDKSEAGAGALVPDSGGTSVAFDPDGTSAGADIDISGALDDVRFRPAGWSMLCWLKLGSEFYNSNPPNPPPGPVDPPSPLDPANPLDPGGGGGGGPLDPGGGGGGGGGGQPWDPTPPPDPQPIIPDPPPDPLPPDPGPDHPLAPTVPGDPAAPTVTDNGDGTGTANWAAPTEGGGCDIDSYRLFNDKGAKIYEGADTTFDIDPIDPYACNAVRVQAHNCRGWSALSPWSGCTKNRGEIAGPYDKFNRADTTTGMGLADNGTMWADAIGSSLRVVSNQAAKAAAGAGGQLLDIGTREQDFTFVVTQQGTFLLYFRAVDANTCYWLTAGSGTGSTATALYARVGGVDRLLDYATGYGTAGSTQTWHVSATSGGRILVARGAQVLFSLSDTDMGTINGTKAGLYLDNSSARADDFLPGDATMPAFVRSYPLNNSVALVWDKPFGHPEATHYKVTVDGADTEYDATSIVVSGLTNWATPAITVTAKIGSDWGNASDTIHGYPGFPDAPTIASITASGSGHVVVTYTLNANHGVTYSSAYAQLNWMTDGGQEALLWLPFSPSPATISGISLGTRRFRFCVQDSSHGAPLSAVGGMWTPWSAPVTVT